MPAVTLGGQDRRPAPVDPTPAAVATKAIKSDAAFDDRLLQTQKPIPGKDAGTLIASTSEATKSASSKGLVSGKGVVLKVNRDNATVKINHEPIPALDWPRMTMPFRLKESALADQVKEGDSVEFFLEKSGPDYVIVKWRK
jgi:Cu(I)/Ag(I) efflux system protein CusF